MGKKLLIPILLCILFFLLYSVHTLNRHFSYHSHAFDLGIYTQAIYLYSQGQLAFSSLKHMIILADHFGVILILLSPIYKLFPSASALLIIQALFVSLSSIPIYLIALDKLKNILLSFVIILTYLTSVGIIAAINFDFHLATISVLPLSIILYAWYFKKWILYTIALFFSILFKEDVSLFIFGLGVYQIVQKRYRVGLLTTAFALISFYIINLKLMLIIWPSTAGSYISTSQLPLDSPITMLYLLLTNPRIFIDYIFNSPIKIGTINSLLREFAFFPVLSSLTWFTVFPYLFLRFTSNYTQLWTTTYHHNANLIPFLTFATILVLEKIKIKKNLAVMLFIFLLFSSGLSPNSFIWSTFYKLNFKNNDDYSYIEKSITLIPQNAAVSAQSPLVPHLANREKIYLFPEILDAQYIILDTSLSSYPINNQQLEDEAYKLNKSTLWKVELQNHTLIIFKKN